MATPLLPVRRSSLLQHQFMGSCWLYSYFWIPGVVCVHSSVTGYARWLTYIVRICVTATESYCIHVNVPIICSPNNIVLRTFVLKKRNKNSTLAYTIDTNISILLYIYIYFPSYSGFLFFRLNLTQEYLTRDTLKIRKLLIRISECRKTVKIKFSVM